MGSRPRAVRKPLVDHARTIPSILVTTWDTMHSVFRQVASKVLVKYESNFVKCSIKKYKGSALYIRGRQFLKTNRVYLQCGTMVSWSVNLLYCYLGFKPRY